VEGPLFNYSPDPPSWQTPLLFSLGPREEWGEAFALRTESNKSCLLSARVLCGVSPLCCEQCASSVMRAEAWC
jgi:hypothetical protein